MILCYDTIQVDEGPRRIDLDKRPHLEIAAKSTRFGPTALCAMNQSGSSMQFVSGGCGGADKSLYLWKVSPRRRDNSQFKVKTTLLPTQLAHRSSVNALAYTSHNDCVISAGRDCWLRMTDLGSQDVKRYEVESGTGEIYQLHVAQPGDVHGQNILLCEVSYP